MKAITSFRGKFRFLSNFWPVKIKLGRLVFDTVEHAYVASKSDDISVRKTVQQLETPGMAKEFGRTLPLRKDWNEEIKLALMKDFVRQKFFFRETLLTRELLLTNRMEIVEGNTWGDTFWGVCNGQGENHLGKIIMSVRDELDEIWNRYKIARETNPNISRLDLAETLGISLKELYIRTCSFPKL